MTKFLEYITDSPIQAIVVIVLFALAVKGLYEFIGWIKKELNKWYDTKNTKEKSDIDVVQRIEHLERENGLQFEKLSSMEDSIIIITDKLDTLSENVKANNVSQARASLYRLYRDFENRESITMSEYETYRSLADLYISHGGNSTFRNKIIPFMESLPVKD